MDKDIQSYIFINKLKSLPFVNEIWLFGSRARGDNDEHSDIDIAIICPNITDQEWLEVMSIIENADTLLKIDCVRFELYKNILKEKKIIYVKNKP
ncbi:nucleotidyltransferase domain-containing protein [Rickettsia argasii]|uniref:Nucleotidyltransferase domain protein n=1 Tax=Rickettsia argasii T170-B TaxID=1268837 RepID=A0A0F3RGJ9_9RICK|nr:nucleotidyltransferase domain-containing protein [Rickettsia argasii]KJW05242.1 nucleotidyltransferase domain protein [Rickettsia argasii T170-B]